LNFHIDRYTYRYTIVQEKERKHKKTEEEKVLHIDETQREKILALNI
jgi:hypothetical protein